MTSQVEHTMLPSYIHALCLNARKIGQSPTVNHSGTVDRLKCPYGDDTIQPVVRTVSSSLKGDVCEVFDIILQKLGLSLLFLGIIFEVDARTWTEHPQRFDIDMISIICLDCISSIEIVVDLTVL